MFHVAPIWLSLGVFGVHGPPFCRILFYFGPRWFSFGSIYSHLVQFGSTLGPIGSHSGPIWDEFSLGRAETCWSRLVALGFRLGRILQPEAPGRLPEARGVIRGILGATCVKTTMPVFWQKWRARTISHERGEGECHRLPYLRTTVARHTCHTPKRSAHIRRHAA